MAPLQVVTRPPRAPTLHGGLPGAPLDLRGSPLTPRASNTAPPPGRLDHVRAPHAEAREGEGRHAQGDDSPRVP